MHDTSSVRGLDCVTDLDDDIGHLLSRKRRVALRVSLEDLAACPFDGEKVKTRPSLTGLDGAHDIRVLDACAEARFAGEPRDGSAILAKLFAQHLEGYDAMLGMVGAVHRRGAAFSDHVLDDVSGERRSDESITRHAANLTSPAGVGKRRRRM